MIRYNQRVVLGLSYVAQFAVPPDTYKVQSLAHRAMHSILHIPPNWFPRNLANIIVFWGGISPHAISNYCASVAVSEASYLEQLRSDIFPFLEILQPCPLLAMFCPMKELNPLASFKLSTIL